MQMDNHFLDDHPELRVHPKEKRPFLKLCKNNMREGKFPDRTQQLSRDKIIFEIRGDKITKEITIAF